MSKGSSATSQKSVQQARKNLTKFLRTLETVPVQEMEQSAITMKANMIAKTPYKDGRLERSVYARVSRDKRRPGIVAGASARDPKTGYNYAGIQHENEKFKHPIKGTDHFISDPFNEEAERLIDRIQKGVKYPGGSSQN